MSSARTLGRLGWALVGLPALLAACGAPSSPSAARVAPASTQAAPAEPAPPAVEIDIALVAFAPETVTAPIGGKVRWRQNDPGAHTVTSGAVAEVPGGVESAPDGVFASERLARGMSFEFTPETAGRIPYFCAIHPATMRGVIIVA